jgi:hypothetical protein
MKYKILIGVIAETGAFRNCVSKCPDKGKLVIVNNWDDKNIAKQCRELEKQGAEVHWHPEDIGCSGAMNVGLKKIDSEGLDYCIILSPSALFTNSIEDFVKIIEEEEKKAKNYYYWSVANFKTDCHAFAITKKCVDEVGLYDENFYPVYYDDTDYGYRMGLIGVAKTPVEPLRISQDLGGGLKNNKRAFDLYWANVNHIHDYYVRKWGGEAGQEIFKTPFNNPNLTIKDWTLEKDKIVWKI